MSVVLYFRKFLNVQRSYASLLLWYVSQVVFSKTITSLALALAMHFFASTIPIQASFGAS